MTQPVCHGLNVLEMGSGSIPASLAGMLLADNGARVVKIEPPGGDRLRTSRPSGFKVWNRGKESWVVDLRTAAGQEQLRRLVADADVVIEAFAPGVADSWGIGYEWIGKTHPHVVYCTIKGFGESSPYAHLPAYEGTVAAKTGHFVLGPFGFREGPIYNDAPMASTGAGHQAFAGILSALTARLQTGQGQRVEATLIGGLVPFDYFGMMTWQQARRSSGNSAPSGAPARSSRTAFTVPTKDGRWINFTHMLPHQARALSRAVGLDYTLEDRRLADQPLFDTPELAQEWEDLVWEALRTKTYAEWEPILLASNDIAFEMARRSEEGLDHPQIQHNGEAITVLDPVVGPIRQVGPTARLEASPEQITKSAPRLDEHGEPLSPPAFRAEAAGRTTLAHPLQGVTIVELGYYYAMPYGLTMAAALGARVIKLEDLRGDPMRWAFGSLEVTSVKVMEGKESLSVDLRSADGQNIVHEIVRNADVFVNGFRPGVAERLNMGADRLCEVNPRLVYLHAAGYGVDGPYAQRPIYAGVASALAGQVVRHAGSWLEPTLTQSLNTVEAQAVVLPRLRGPVDGDANAALAVLSVLLMGIYHQRRTGQGQVISTSMIGGNALAYADDFIQFAEKPDLPLPDPDNHGLHALYRLYPAERGWVFLAAPGQEDWETLTKALDRSDLAAEERFCTPEARQANDEALVAELGAVFAKREAQRWEDDLVPGGVGLVAASESAFSEFMCTDSRVRAGGFVEEIDNRTFGTILRAAPALRFSQTSSRHASSCLTGEHTEAILHDLGYDAEAIDRLKSNRAIGVLES